MLARPTLLESTVLVFAFGNGDVFGTRVTPSQAFDVLGKGFSKIQLTLTVVALGVGVLILSPMVSFLPLFSLSFRLRFYTFIFIKFIIMDHANFITGQEEADECHVEGRVLIDLSCP